MHIKLWTALIEKIGLKTLQPWGIEEPSKYRHNEYQTIALEKHRRANTERLLKLIEPHCEAKVKGARTCVADIKAWMAALDGKDPKARNPRLFEALARNFFYKEARRNEKEGRPFGPRLYKRDENRGVWQAYWVKGTIFHPEEQSRGEYHPPRAEIEMVYEEFGARNCNDEYFKQDDVSGCTVEQALVQRGYVVETPEIWNDYCERYAKFKEWQPKLGMQLWATGKATDNCDGNGDSNRWRAEVYDLDIGGTRSRVLIDLFYEQDANKDRSNGNAYIAKLFWRRDPTLDWDDDDDVDEGGEPLEADNYPSPEFPLHFNLACFDLKRHKRLRIDVGQLEPYVYDPSLGDKLVMPQDPRMLVDMMLSGKGVFNDIIRGKSGGTIVLCAGPPGVGKTLTAEVYAEIEKRGLYSVQCSQLGMRPDELEGELMECFTRAQRWNAIMLLDEADVYVRARGEDLHQNAIVGVFLRVLEYYSGALFLTTNRSEMVDDAILSRCTARIDYKVPTQDDQRKIWKVLRETSGILISDEVIEQVVQKYPELTGRDVKNLLKLGKLVSDSRRIPINLDVITFVKRFKPTGVTETEEVELPMGEVLVTQKRIVRRPVAG